MNAHPETIALHLDEHVDDLLDHAVGSDGDRHQEARDGEHNC
jgi:hypothetical protein